MLRHEQKEISMLNLCKVLLDERISNIIVGNINNFSKMHKLLIDKENIYINSFNFVDTLLLKCKDGYVKVIVKSNHIETECIN